MKELRRRDVPDGKYTLAFVGYGDEDSNTAIELTYNYGVEKYEMGGAFGHLAIGVPDVAAACEIAAKAGGTVTRPAGTGEVRHHDHRLRQGPGRLHDRTGAAAVVFGRGGRKTWKPHRGLTIIRAIDRRHTGFVIPRPLRSHGHVSTKPNH